MLKLFLTIFLISIIPNIVFGGCSDNSVRGYSGSQLLVTVQRERDWIPRSYCQINLASNSTMQDQKRITIRNDGQVKLDLGSEGKAIFSIIPTNGSLESAIFGNKRRFFFNPETYIDVDVNDSSISFSPNLEFTKLGGSLSLKPLNEKNIVIDYGQGVSGDRNIDHQARLFGNNGSSQSCDVSSGKINDYFVRTDGRPPECGVRNDDLLGVGFYPSTDDLNWYQRNDTQRRSRIPNGGAEAFTPAERRRFITAQSAVEESRVCRNLANRTSPYVRMEFNSLREYRASSSFDHSEEGLPKTSIPKFLEFSSPSDYQEMFDSAGCNISFAGIEINGRIDNQLGQCQRTIRGTPLSVASIRNRIPGIGPSSINPAWPPRSFDPPTLISINGSENIEVPLPRLGETFKIRDEQRYVLQDRSPPEIPQAGDRNVRVYRPIPASEAPPQRRVNPQGVRNLNDIGLTNQQRERVVEAQDCRSQGYQNGRPYAELMRECQIDVGEFTRSLSVRPTSDPEVYLHPLFEDGSFTINRGPIEGIGNSGNPQLDENFRDFLNSDSKDYGGTEGRTVLQQCIYEATGVIRAVAVNDTSANGFDPNSRGMGFGNGGHSLQSCHSVGRAIDFIGGITSNNQTIGMIQGQVSPEQAYPNDPTYKFRNCWHRMNLKRCGLDPQNEYPNVIDLIGSVGNEDSNHQNHLHLSMPLCRRLGGFDSRREEPETNNSYFCPK